MAGAAVLIALVPAAASVPALAALAVVVALTAGIVIVEAVRYADVRAEIRSSQHAPVA